MTKEELVESSLGYTQSCCDVPARRLDLDNLPATLRTRFLRIGDRESEAKTSVVDGRAAVGSGGDEGARVRGVEDAVEPMAFPRDLRESENDQLYKMT